MLDHIFISMIHSVINIIVSFICLYYNLNPIYSFLISFVYYVWDIIKKAKDLSDPYNKQILFHHIFGILAGIFTLSDYRFWKLYLNNQFMEISTIFLNLFRYKKSTLNALLFFVAFSLVRIYPIMVFFIPEIIKISMTMISSNDSLFYSIFFVIGSLSFYCLQFYWFYRICLKLIGFVKNKTTIEE